MTGDGLTMTVDTAALLTALATLADAAQPLVKAAAHETAIAIQTEMKSRLSRALGPSATGQTVAGIVVVEDASGTGYLVEATRDFLPNLPLWLEKGTKRGQGKHPNVARPFFYVSALLEEGAHFQRVSDAVKAALDQTGLGD